MQKSMQVEAAFALYREACHWDSATRVILSAAEKLIGESRWKSIVSWIAMLPPDLIATDAWLLHWRGTALIASQPDIARGFLEKAYAMAVANRNALCAIQSAAGIVETHVLEYTDLTTCDRCLPILNSAFAEGIAIDSPECEARVLAAFLNGLVYRDPGNSNIERYVARALALFDSDLNAILRMTLLVPLNYCGPNCGHLDVAVRVISALEPVRESVEVTDLRKGLFCNASIHYYSFLMGDNVGIKRIAKFMQDLAAESGFAFILSWAVHCEGNVAAR